MKLNIKNTIIEASAYSFIVLYTYAAFSKLAAYESFRIQLGQSPLLSAYAGWIAWCIPVIEILFALMLMFRQTRFFAFVGSYALMIMFTAYIIIILNYSEFIPCSCGGVLEEMTWNQHLMFNIGFCILALVAIFLSEFKNSSGNNREKNRYLVVLLFFTTLFAGAIVTGLYIKSEQLIHEENNFIRRYPPHLYTKSERLDLKYEGYYFAGQDKDNIILGNNASPLSVLVLNKKLEVIGKHTIQLDNYKLPYRSAVVRVIQNTFFLTDGTVPCIFRGSTEDWKGKQLKTNKAYFSVFEPIDSVSAFIRSREGKTRESIVGKVNFGTHSKSLNWNKDILKKQIDGIFDTDGMLRYDTKNKAMVYTYCYRNQFMVVDRNLKLNYRGKTIDTTTHAKIKIDTTSAGDRKMAAPPFMVNKLSAFLDNRLYINSELRGHYESLKLWKQTAAIDVYNTQSKKYEYSFYVYRNKGEKPQGMYTLKDKVYFLFKKEIVAYTKDTVKTTAGKHQE